MKTREQLEYRALLAASGEAHLDDDERRRTAGWSRDADALTQAARAASAGDPPSGPPALGPAARQALARRRRRFRGLYLFQRLAAAALLVLVAGSAMMLHTQRREQRSLERLESILFLLSEVDIEAELETDDNFPTSTPLTLETLAEQLSQMQFAYN